MLMAQEYGIKEMKFFPAHLSGGPEMLKALSSIFKGVQFCPTGGITGDNVGDYLSLPNVFAVGGTWMIPKNLVAAGNWEGITKLCVQAQAGFQKEAA